MAPKLKKVTLKYGFPIFTKNESTSYIVRNEKLRVSDIWSFWDYIIRMHGKHQDELKFLLSLLEQARYFYDTAEQAPVKSQPLLFYYSFLNLAKIVINIANYTGIASEYNHGIETSVTHQTNLSNAEIKIKSLAGGSKISVCNQFFRSMENPLNFVANTPYQLMIKDCLQSCIGIHRTFSETFNEDETYYRIVNSELIKTGKELCFECEIHPCDNSIMELLNNHGYSIYISEGKYKWRETIMMKTYSVTRKDYYDLSQKIKNKGIWYYTDGNEYRMYISSNRSLALSPESLIYSTMFFFGSITRYHPYLFDSLLSKKELWLVDEFLRTQPKQFLYLVTSRVIGQGIFKSRTSNI